MPCLRLCFSVSVFYTCCEDPYLLTESQCGDLSLIFEIQHYINLKVLGKECNVRVMYSKMINRGLCVFV